MNTQANVVLPALAFSFKTTDENNVVKSTNVYIAESEVNAAKIAKALCGGATMRTKRNTLWKGKQWRKDNKGIPTELRVKWDDWIIADEFLAPPASPADMSDEQLLEELKKRALAKNEGLLAAAQEAIDAAYEQRSGDNDAE